MRECTGQVGDWGDVGQTRTIVLADGSSNLETLVALDRPGSYRYRLTDFTGSMKALIRSVDGEFAFAAHDGGTRATWTWQIHPTHAVARLLLPVMGVFWRRYAARMWPRFAARLRASIHPAIHPERRLRPPVDFLTNPRRTKESRVARVVVDVMPKPEILDPQGKAVQGALPRLGFSGVTDVRQGKRFELEIDGEVTDDVLADVHKMAETLLSNPVIENFSVHVEPAP